MPLEVVMGARQEDVVQFAEAQEVMTTPSDVPSVAVPSAVVPTIVEPSVLSHPQSSYLRLR